MESVSCLFCPQKMYSAKLKVGKVKCPSCGGEFFVGYDEIRQLWIATDRESPVQLMMIRKVRKNEPKQKKEQAP